MKVALLGDTMLGRLVADRLAATPRAQLFSGEVVAIIHEADLTVMNLECAVSDRGEPWPDRFKRFWFRAPPVAIETLTQLGVSCVTLANNHAMDFGTVALLDTLDLLDAAGIAVIGAGPTEVASRRPAVLDRAGMRIAIAGFADHPADFAAGPNEPGIAYANLRRGVRGGSPRRLPLSRPTSSSSPRTGDRTWSQNLFPMSAGRQLRSSKRAQP